MKTAQQSTAKTTGKSAAKSDGGGGGAKRAKKTTLKATPEAIKKADPLSMCPVNGAGWCPYPFSVAQLKRRLKAKEEAARAAQAKNLN